MPSKSVPDPVPYVQWMLHSKDVSAQILKVFAMKSKWLCQAGTQAGDHGRRRGRALRNPTQWTGTANWWLPGVRDNALPSLVFSFPPATHAQTSSPCRCCDLAQPLLALNFPKPGALAGLCYCGLAVGRPHLLSQPASIHQSPLCCGRQGARWKRREGHVPM